LQAAVARARAAHDSRLEIELSLEQAIRYPKVTTTLRQVERSLSLSDSLKEFDLSLRVMEALIPLELSLQRYAVVIAIGTRYLAVVDSSLHPQQVVLARCALAEAHLARGEHARALHLVQLALSGSPRGSSNRYADQLQLLRCRAERKLGEYDRALAGARELMRRCAFRADSCYLPQYEIEHELGECLLAQGQWVEAEVRLAAAAAVARLAGDSLASAKSTLGLASIYLAQGQPQRAVATLQKPELALMIGQEVQLTLQRLQIEHRAWLALQRGDQASRVYAELSRLVYSADSADRSSWLGQLPLAMSIAREPLRQSIQSQNTIFHGIVQGFVALATVLAVGAMLVRWGFYRRRREELRALGSAKARAKAVIEEAAVLSERLAEEARQQQEVLLSLQAQHESMKVVSAEIEQHSAKLTSSMEYTVRIQQALFPEADRFDRFCNDWFLLQQPKEIVAGDFYWLHEAGKRTVIAVGSCSVQGVPGALLSVAAYSMLSQFVLDREIPDAGTLLTFFERDVRKKLFIQATHSGLSLSLAILVVDRAQRSLYFASADMPLYYTHRGKLYVLKGNPHPITSGNSSKAEFFANFLMYDVEHNFYLITPGMSKQVGGQNGHPMGEQRVTELIENTSSLGLKQQRQALSTELISFRGEHRQTADILAMGFNFKS
jgi:serine phosphatase RsbU (regulator of sigma subunit)